MRYSVLVLFYLFISIVCSDASEIEISEFIATAKNANQLNFQGKKIEFLEGSSSNTPWFDEVEYRFEVNQFDDYYDHTHTLRLSPIGWGEAKYGKKVYNISLDAGRAQYDLLLNKAIKNRYNTVVDYLYEKEIKELTGKLMVLYDDRIKVLKRSVNNLDFDAQNLIDAEDKDIKLQLDMIDLENQIVEIEDEIRSNILVGDQIGFNAAKMVDIAFIEKTIAGLDTALDKENVHLRNSKLEMEYAQAMYKLEKAENRRHISFLQVEYDNDERDNIFDEAISLAIGVRLPIVNPDRLDINRRKLRSIREKSKYKKVKRDLADDIANFSRDLKRLISQHKVLLRKKEDINSESSLNIYKRVDGVNPLILLKIKESILKTDVLLVKTRHRIFKKYIDLLDVSGKLSEEPLKNYLSSDLEPIIL